jgi:hypothetical protein
MHARVCLLILLLISLSSRGLAGPRAERGLQPVPPGTWLPVRLQTSLDAKHAHVGQLVSTVLAQRVPLDRDHYLPPQARVLGHVVQVSKASLTIQFDQVVLRGQTEPIAVKLIAVAQWTAVEETGDPVGATDRSTSDPSEWTTRQVGGDEVYRSNWYGPVENQYSERVGQAGPHGVYADPRSPDGVPLALGPFSTTAHGLYDLPELTLASPGARHQPIVFGLVGPHWELHRADALLLEVVR